MKYLLLFITILLANIAYATPQYTTMTKIYEDSVVIEFVLTASYDVAGVCWNTTGAPDILDNVVYSNGAGIGSHQVTVTGLTSSTLFYFRAFEKNDAVPTANYSKPITLTKAIWLGTTSSWSTSSNWQDSRDPEDSDVVIIPDVTNDPIVASNITINQIIINDGGNITINDNVTLTVENDFTIKGASGSSGILLEGDGSIAVSGTSTYERYIPKDNWHLISLPNSNSSITQLQGLYVNNWIESSASWNQLTASSSLNVMQGYNVRYGTQARTIPLTGAFNNGSQSTTVTNNLPGGSPETATYGWNLVGNPYPSPIDWDASDGWTRTNINGTVFVYDASIDDYIEFNYSSETGPFYIPPTQGFFVWSVVSSTTLGMDNDVRALASTDFQKKEVEFPIIKLRIENQYKSDITKIIFHPEATGNFEVYDGMKLFGWHEDLPQLYTYSDDDKLLSINTINSELLDNPKEVIVLQLGYKSQIETPISLTIDEIEGFNEDMTIGIYDNVLSVYQDITNLPYEFVTNIGEFNDRFDLYISKAPNNLTELSSNTVNCYIHNNNLIINTEEPIHNGKILIYDVLGRPIINKSLTTKTQHVFIIPEKTNIFVVNIIEDETFLYRKTLVK